MAAPALIRGHIHSIGYAAFCQPASAGRMCQVFIGKPIYAEITYQIKAGAVFTLQGIGQETQ